jgi:MoxR-like ATPase
MNANLSSAASSSASPSSADASAAIADFAARINAIKAQMARVIVGQEQIVEGVLMCLCAGGHVLLEGVPGLGKTLMVRTLAGSLGLDFSRIQFTPDLMPADVTGTNIIAETPEGRKEFQFQRGPCSPMCCWPMKSTAPHPKPRARCSKRCRNTA